MKDEDSVNPDSVSDLGEPISETALTTIVEHMAASTEDKLSYIITPTGDGVGWMVTISPTTLITIGGHLVKAAHQDFIAAVELASGRAVDVMAELKAEEEAFAQDED